MREDGARLARLIDELRAERVAVTMKIPSLPARAARTEPSDTRTPRPAARTLRVMGLAIALGAAGCGVGEEVSLRARRAELEGYLAANLRAPAGADRDRRVASNRYHLGWIALGLRERWSLGGHGTRGPLGVAFGALCIAVARRS